MLVSNAVFPIAHYSRYCRSNNAKLRSHSTEMVNDIIFLSRVSILTHAQY